jgi:membrane protease YdiL (CAAX protease family)
VFLWVPIGAFLKLTGIVALEITPRPFLKSSGLLSYSWIMLTALLTAFAEELMFRGYLISRLVPLFGIWKTVLISSIVFSMAHFPYGISGHLDTFLGGIIFGIVFAKTRTLWPLVIAHSFRNTVAYVLVNLDL